jgi:hypothetical protein
MNEIYRRCGIDLCGFCFPSKNPGKVRCEYLSAMQSESQPEELEKAKECKYQQIRIESSKKLPS